MNNRLKSCGIIAEYNPFHNGHAYQIKKAKEMSHADVMVAVMSGNFVQRGEPAIVDKYKRAKCAIENGIDCVIELPYFYATQAATGFAHGGVSILKQLHVDGICFGSECGNLENLQEIADTHINPDHLRLSLETGMSFAKSYSLLTSTMAPNDILAVSYLKECKGTNIKPYIVQRTNGYLDTELKSIASAYAIRQAMQNGQSYDHATPMADVLHCSETVVLDSFYPYLRTFLLTSHPSYLRQFFLYNEGIEHHLIKNALKYDTFSDFLNGCITHRYTASRIKRTIIQTLLQFTKDEYESLKNNFGIRILGFNDQGRLWLKQCKDDNLSFASKFSQLPEKQREIEYRSTLVYTSNLSSVERNRILKEEITGAHYYAPTKS